MKGSASDTDMKNIAVVNQKTQDDIIKIAARVGTGSPVPFDGDQS